MLARSLCGPVAIADAGVLVAAVTADACAPVRAMALGACDADPSTAAAVGARWAAPRRERLCRRGECGIDLRECIERHAVVLGVRRRRGADARRRVAVGPHDP